VICIGLVISSMIVDLEVVATLELQDLMFAVNSLKSPSEDWNYVYIHIYSGMK